MSVPTAYLTSTKNAAAIFEAIQKAGVPETFSYEFLKQLGFSSSADRPMIPVMKSIGFIDQSGAPTALYRTFKDKALAGQAIAKGVRSAYSDVFAVDTEAQSKTVAQLTGIFGRVSDKGEAVSSKMATTFKFLCGLADFDGAPSPQVVNLKVGNDLPSETEGGQNVLGGLSLRHDIHIHLPVSTDVAVYDAIFKGLKANLL
jgi:hypothetical protein